VKLAVVLLAGSLAAQIPAAIPAAIGARSARRAAATYGAKASLTLASGDIPIKGKKKRIMARVGGYAMAGFLIFVGAKQ
jgi:hypothetical protein